VNLVKRIPLVVGLVSALTLVAVVVAWVAWPDGERRADLVAVAEPEAPPTTPAPPTTTTTTTAPAPSTTAAPAPPPTGGPTEPVGLQIPALGLDARVVSVALEPDGQMEVPAAAEVGWYRLGPQPGAGGSAVLAAHIDYGGAPGAFYSLPRLGVGEEVSVLGIDGTVQRFRVTDRAQIAKDEIRLEQYFTDQGTPRLTLITCGGAFDPGARSYEDNIVVTAVPV
jgi:hypothetical protein